MTTTAADATIQPGEHEPSAPRRRTSTVVLTGIIAIAVLVVAVTGGVLWGRHTVSSSSATGSAVDIGFAQDMSVHHQQAITMAVYAENNTDNTSVKTVAYDIESSQSVQLGTMTGWLQQWGAPQLDTAPMKWMVGHQQDVGPNGLMPGMATPAEMAKLQTLHGKALDIMFLQLMIRHHQGGIEMAQYAAQHATASYVVLLAQNMYNTQSAEIVNMEQQLRSLGGTPLAPPAD